MARVTNEQLKTAMESIDTRLTNVETILMSKGSNGNGKRLDTPMLVRWVIFPLIVVLGGIFGIGMPLSGG